MGAAVENLNMSFDSMHYWYKVCDVSSVSYDDPWALSVNLSEIQTLPNSCAEKHCKLRQSAQLLTVTLSLSQVEFLSTLSLLCLNFLEATAEKTHQTHDGLSVS